MGTAKSMTAVAEIIEKAVKAGDRVAAVVSATSGTTDKLLGLCERALKSGDWEVGLDEIIERHQNIIDELGLDLDLSAFWLELEKVLQGVHLISELSLSAKDKIAGFGERVSSNILAALLNKGDRKANAEGLQTGADGRQAAAMDAYNFIFTDNNFGEGNVDFKKTYRAIEEVVRPVIEKGVIPVITGFIGQSENGQYITLGRGGSDYTGAIIAAALGADELQIWTDVDGIFNTDPRLVKEARVLSKLSFAEAGELAYFGAKVLHPKTIRPAIEKNIPVKILNTFNISALGTLVTNEEEESIKSVTYKKGITIINVCSAGMLEAKGFLKTLFAVFDRRGVSVDVVSTSEVSVSLTVDNGIPKDLIAELEEFSTVNVYKDMAIVCLVGGGIRTQNGILGKLFSAVSDHNISMVSQGASKRNITFLVREEEAPEVTKKVFYTFFNK